MNSLLPPNSTPQERALSDVVARLTDVPVLVRESWDPDTCPAELLPWLAWTFSVDQWEADWTEQQKRTAIKNSVYIHRHKGTIGAIDRALQPLGYLVEVVEWWQESPPGEPYTFRVTVGTEGVPFDESLYDKAEKLVLQYKNLRSHLTNMKVTSDVFGAFYVGAATIDGVDTTVYPQTI